MEEIYVNVEYDKCGDSVTPKNLRGPRSSEKRFYGALVLCLGLLNVIQLAVLISLGVHYRGQVHGLTAELSNVKDNLTQCLQTTIKLSSLTEERDQLNTSLSEMAKELNRSQTLSQQNRGQVHGLTAELSNVKDNLTQCLQTTIKLSSLTEERDQLNTSLSEMAKELNRSQTLSQQNRDRVHGLTTELSTVKVNLIQCLQTSNKVSSLTEERNQLNTRLSEMAKELNRSQSFCKQKKTCPTGWTQSSSSCYLRSSQKGSWETGRRFCRDRQADLVVIDSRQEQTFLSTFTLEAAWIGLNDKKSEGTWTWVDYTPLTLMYWERKQPDNGNNDPLWGEEDCVHIRTEESARWNDRSCEASLHWICEKIA